MMSQNKANIILVIVTIFWGATYFLTKMELQDIQPFTLIAMRFIIAFIVSGIVLYKHIINTDKVTIKYAFVLAILLFLVFISMTYGLKYTSASNAGFLISLSVVLIPVLSFVILKQKIDKKVLYGICCATIGIALLTLNGELKVNIGDLLCILSAALYALHIIITDIFTKEVDSISLGILQLGFVGFFSSVIAIFTENVYLPNSKLSWIVILLLSIFCTAFGYIAQTFAQKYTSAVHTGLILSLEPVFSVIFGYLFLGEVLKLRGYFGAAILLLSILLVEFKWIYKIGVVGYEISLKKIISHKNAAQSFAMHFC